MVEYDFMALGPDQIFSQGVFVVVVVIVVNNVVFVAKVVDDKSEKPYDVLPIVLSKYGPCRFPINISIIHILAKEVVL